MNTSCKWFPLYGCAIVVAPSAHTGWCDLLLVYPDAWKTELMGFESDIHYFATPQDYTVLELGTIESDTTTSFFAKLDGLVENAQEKKGDARTAATMKQGHQKTPSFIQCLVREALLTEEPPTEVLPFGGTTDVGQHTGFKPRATSWPVVCSVLAMLLADGNVFAKIRLELLVWLAERQCSSLTAAKLTPKNINITFALLTYAVNDTLAMDAMGFDSTEWTDRLQNIRQRLDLTFKMRLEQDAKSFALDDTAMSMLPIDLAGQFPTSLPQMVAIESKETIQKRALANSEALPPFDITRHFDDPDAFGFLILWSQSHKRLGEIHPDARLLVLHQIELLMWHFATYLAADTPKLTLSEKNCTDIRDVVKMYSSLVNTWLNSTHGKQQVDVIVRSKEMLVTWVAYCTIHHTCEAQHPLVREYKTALNWEDLRHLVLSDRKATEALQLVAQYIRQRSSRKWPLFSLQDPAGTSGYFARAFAQQDEKILQRWHTEEHKLNLKKQTYMQEVRTKKARLVQLRAQTPNLERAVREASEERDERYNETYRSGWHEYHIFRELRDDYNASAHALQVAKTRLNAHNREIQKISIPPRFIVNPLPTGRGYALTVLFFFLIPYRLNILAELSELSLEMLQPRPAKRNPQVYHTWAKHYNAYAQDDSATEGHFQLMPIDLAVPQEYGPSSVDDIADNDSRFVWDPTPQQHRLTSVTGRTSFPIDSASTQKLYTSQLRPFTSLQWCVDAPSEDSNIRGNMVYSKLKQKPDKMAKTAFLALGSLRSYPHLQFRKLMFGLMDNTLQLDHAVVRIAIRQALYHIGDLSNENEPQPVWRSDMRRAEGLQGMLEALEKRANDIQETPREHKSIIMLAEITAYLAQYYPQARQLSRKLLDIVQGWIDSIDLQLSTASPTQVMELRAKQCLMHGYAILCIGEWKYQEFTAQDLTSLLTHMALFKNRRLAGHGSTVDLDLKWMDIHAQGVMAVHVNQITDWLRGSFRFGSAGHDCLSKCVQSVLPAPEKLKWSHINGTFCFEASARVRDFDEHYLVNALTGCILLNGSPPGRLPSDILQHSTYKKYFCKQDFEVIQVKSGGNVVYRTTRTFDGEFIYEFSLSSGNSTRAMKIQEVNTRNEKVLDLIEFDDSTWFQSLPTRLRQMHSVWVDYSSESIVFRGIPFHDRNISFFGLKVTDDEHCDEIHCYQVPSIHANMSVEMLAKMRSSLPYFLDASDFCWVYALSKFELAQFIHVLQAPNDEVWFQLPRFNLTFISSKLNDGKYLHCREFSDFRLSGSQQFDHTLGFFTQYIVLDRIKSTPCQPARIILVPNGIVEVNALEKAFINLPKNCDASLSAFAYEEAPYSKQFCAKTVAGRLQLATILAASSSNLPDPHLKMTGSEYALVLLRQCWTSRPLTANEDTKLANLTKFAFKEPALAVLCEQLKFETQHRAFLFAYAQNNAPRAEDRILVSKAELRSNMSSPQPWNTLRRGLNEREVKKCIRYPPRHRRAKNYRGENSIEKSDSPPVSASIIFELEDELFNMAEHNETVGDDTYPLIESHTTSIGVEITEGLKSSWSHHKSNLDFKIENVEEVASRIKAMKSQVKEYCQEMEIYLRNTVKNAVPIEEKCTSDLLYASNQRACVSMDDWLRIAVDEIVLVSLNPYFSEHTRRTFQSSVRVYLALIVLSYRLERLQHQLLNSESKATLMQELLCKRTWSWDEHPRWLVFEVEQHLQIRPEQYAIVNHLLESPQGTICQLNMGLGKTRVILPMLILHYTSLGQVPRVHVLPSILREALDVLHLRLTASTMTIDIVEQPFHRQIELSSQKIDVLRQQITNSCYVVSSEHRLSLEMKVREWAFQQNNLTKKLGATIQDLKFVDLFDECDALFHYRYQLVYAVGTPAPLEQCELRATTGHALLRILNSREPAIDQWINQNATVVPAQSTSKFRAIRLRENDANCRREFRLLILRALIANPPTEFQWLKMWCDKNPTCLQWIESNLVDVSGSASLLRYHFTNDIHRQYLLSLRGYLAFGLLEHALEQRHRVDYGIDSRRNKRTAVPFRAADMPSERSEYGHPDVGLVLTTLAYYYHGLSADQIFEAIKFLLTLGRPAQNAIYGAVISPLRAELSLKELSMIEHVSKLDLSNAIQMDVLASKLSHSQELINFWLVRCVFEMDLAQYPARISASSWDLAQSHNAKGFSGTNDTNSVLPLQITSNNPKISSILGTNGRMVAQLLNHTLSCNFLNSNNSMPLWKRLVEFTLHAESNALIDTGSLLAGVSNQDIAEFMAAHEAFNEKYHGVVYFDPNQHQWMVLNRQTRQILELHISPIKECHCFVLFDDARSRGTDMHLQPDAVAVLTLGPKLTKDKLMQGAGRMRQLENNQKLLLVAPSDLEQALKPFTIQSTLEWIVGNTVSSIERGLLTWSQQGLQFCKSQESTFNGVTDENWKLQDLFEAAISKDSLAAVIHSTVQSTHNGSELAAEINGRCHALGQEIEVALQYNEECERELQLEEEQERELEHELPNKDVIEEAPWDYATALDASSVNDLCVEFKLLSYSATVGLANGLALINWPSTVYGTINFFSTVKLSNLEYIRRADAALVLPSGEWILLSDKEADAILGLLWLNPVKSVGFVHLSGLAFQAHFSNSQFQHSCNLTNEASALKLYNGETMFAGETRQEHVKQFVANQGCRSALLSLLVARGEKQNWDCSDLKRICELSL
ncbi:hypothetical protein Ae201684_016188 [Aphanomyces euteiches]|uniref:ubiquitinyl hydrolase 1 n=1 Tax=Aphanomyces euteiches TaxID=100861 RepID=A0A6G0WEI8_9STRA|nr:hypothetical protein Ae201684_016188 [Aphanomyces euteiches]